MNGGHSAAAMLHAHPAIVVHSFDIMYWNYSWPVARLLQSTFPTRFHLHPGDSRQTVPQWAAELAQAAPAPSSSSSSSSAEPSDALRALRRRRPCDMLLVDGDHTLGGASADLHNLRELAAPAAAVIVDDTATSPGLALQRLASSGALRIRESYGPYDPPSRFNRCLRTYNRGPMCLPWGFSVAQYVQ